MATFESSTSYAFKNTSFPSKYNPIATSSIALLDKFFRIVDTSAPQDGEQQGQQLVDEIFTSEGIWKTPLKTFTGSQDLSNSLLGIWDTRKARIHEVLKVFVHDEQGLEWMMLGRMTVNYTDGRREDLHFAARVEIEAGLDEEEKGKGPRMKFFQGWVTRS